SIEVKEPPKVKTITISGDGEVRTIDTNDAIELIVEGNGCTVTVTNCAKITKIQVDGNGNVISVTVDVTIDAVILNGDGNVINLPNSPGTLTDNGEGNVVSVSEGMPAEEETGSYHYENDGTVTGSSPCRVLITGETEPFPVEAGAKRFVVTVSSDKDIDLYIEDPNGDIVESSATAETTETIEITNPSPAGEWNAWITLWSMVHRPFNSADYHIVIDVYYE
ncbi:MAG: hypothetical protein QMC80_05840, partial [Thermoplasmatales archaeon]|nr:hypothetical protein [Thermoplasmatales archaeon]